jgi:hypothetical protein
MTNSLHKRSVTRRASSQLSGRKVAQASKGHVGFSHTSSDSPRFIAAYVRLAEDDRIRGKKQADDCLTYSHQHFGAEPDLLYSDLGASGMDVERAGFQELTRAIRAGHVHSVITRDLSRISRSLPNLVTFFELLRKHEISLHSTAGGGPITDLFCSTLLVNSRDTPPSRPRASTRIAYPSEACGRSSGR